MTQRSPTKAHGSHGPSEGGHGPCDGGHGPEGGVLVRRARERAATSQDKVFMAQEMAAWAG